MQEISKFLPMAIINKKEEAMIKYIYKLCDSKSCFAHDIVYLLSQKAWPMWNSLPALVSKPSNSSLIHSHGMWAWRVSWRTPQMLLRTSVQGYHRGMTARRWCMPRGWTYNAYAIASPTLRRLTVMRSPHHLRLTSVLRGWRKHLGWVWTLPGGWPSRAWCASTWSAAGCSHGQ